jgi:hypothetical protein
MQYFIDYNFKNSPTLDQDGQGFFFLWAKKLVGGISYEFGKQTIIFCNLD